MSARETTVYELALFTSSTELESSFLRVNASASLARATSSAEIRSVMMLIYLSLLAILLTRISISWFKIARFSAESSRTSEATAMRWTRRSFSLWHSLRCSDRRLSAVDYCCWRSLLMSLITLDTSDNGVLLDSWRAIVSIIFFPNGLASNLREKQEVM